MISSCCNTSRPRSGDPSDQHMSREVAKHPSRRLLPRHSSAPSRVAYVVAHVLVGSICHPSSGQAGPPRVHEQPGATARKMMRPFATAAPDCWFSTVMIPASRALPGRRYQTFPHCRRRTYFVRDVRRDVFLPRATMNVGDDANQYDGARRVQRTWRAVWHVATNSSPMPQQPQQAIQNNFFKIHLFDRGQVRLASCALSTLRLLIPCREYQEYIASPRNDLQTHPSFPLYTSRGRSRSFVRTYILLPPHSLVPFSRAL